METILHNDPLMAAVISWFLAQLTKVVFKLFKTGEFDFAKFFASGGMPSSHASTVTALATGVGVVEGVESTFYLQLLLFLPL